MSKEKIQGTKLETYCVQLLNSIGIKTRRLPEGGSADEGDFEAYINGERWIGECKARQQLSMQTTLAKVRKKAAGAPVFLVWKRLMPAASGARRKPVAGERTIVVLSLEDFMKIINSEKKEETND